MKDILIVVVLIIVIAAAAFITVKKLRRGGGCCGEHEASVKSRGKKGKRKAELRYETTLKILGMTCENCAKRVENALNENDDILASVSLSKGTAKILTKTEPDIKRLCAIVSKAGYGATPADS